MDLTLHAWRQAGPDEPGRMATYADEAKDISPDMSFLEMLDIAEAFGEFCHSACSGIGNTSAASRDRYKQRRSTTSNAGGAPSRRPAERPTRWTAP